MLPRAKKASSKHSSSKSFQFWDPDVVIVFDPAEQKLFKGSRAKIETDPDWEKQYTIIKLPKLSNSVECYIDGVGKSNQKVVMGTVNLGKLGWHLNMNRHIGKVKELYVLGNIQCPE